jgi:glyoxylase I family protein
MRPGGSYAQRTPPWEEIACQQPPPLKRLWFDKGMKQTERGGRPLVPGSAESWEERVAIGIRGLCPLLHVFDMPTSLRFYRDILGFSEVEKSGADDRVGWAWLRQGDAELMLNTAYDEGERPAAPDPARVAAHADTIVYMGCEYLDAAYTDLQARGVRVDPPKVAPYGMKQMYATDPDGYGICFQWPEGQRDGRDGQAGGAGQTSGRTRTEGDKAGSTSELAARPRVFDGHVEGRPGKQTKEKVRGEEASYH